MNKIEHQGDSLIRKALIISINRNRQRHCVWSPHLLDFLDAIASREPVLLVSQSVIIVLIFKENVLLTNNMSPILPQTDDRNKPEHS